ncbi:cofilin/actin-depolymerizing factor homolog [Bradysia coprophila]|uniref:cofilin/actin-depolymerizing factor homolog n=1 Tax=Bradysia coprophila TaxID=38358 RepID=UPI00187DCF7D|nr:cofilin/actin-depolymerizing factor homolog [Bradysia coprophila]
MASGVAVSDDCIRAFENIKNSKVHRFAIFMIVGNKIDVEQVGSRDASYDEFLSQLKAGEGKQCRYGVYDYEYTYQHQGTASVAIKQKLFLMLWCPDTASVSNKMIYASSYESLKHALVGIQKYIQANDDDEASQETVEEILRSTDRK